MLTALFRSGLPPHVFSQYLPSILKFLALHADDENVKKHSSYDKSAEVVELDESRYELLSLSGLCANGEEDASPALAISLVRYLSDPAGHDAAKDEGAWDGFFLYVPHAFLHFIFVTI